MADLGDQVLQQQRLVADIAWPQVGILQRRVLRVLDLQHGAGDKRIALPSVPDITSAIADHTENATFTNGVYVIWADGLSANALYGGASRIPSSGIFDVAKLQVMAGGWFHPSSVSELRWSSIVARFHLCFCGSPQRFPWSIWFP
jgi:hypothetical protein